MYDVIVVGAGFCGSIVGIKAGDLGLKVKVLDSQADYPRHFRAEKLESDQSDSLDALGLLSLVRPSEFEPINEVRAYRRNSESISLHQGHRGIDYADTVNAFRKVLHDRGVLEIRRVSAIEDDQQSCRISLDNGHDLQSRLVVVASGMSTGLRRQMGLVPSGRDSLISTTFGFDIRSLAAEGLPHSACNFRPDRFVNGLAYITFFPIGNRMRANLFTCWDPSSDEVRQTKADTLRKIRELFPDIDRRLGPFEICTDIQAYTTRYYRLAAEHLHRTVIVGDAYQSVNPANGVGLSKCLTDSQVVFDLLPRLLESSSSLLDLEQYYADSRKQRIDDEARDRWRWTSESTTSRSLKTRLKILKRGASERLRELTN